MRHISSFDFGLTDFAGRFHQDWGYEGSAEELVGRLLGPETDPSVVEELRSDASLMRSRLTTEEIETLWAAGTGGNFRFGPDGAWPSGSAWLDRISEACDWWLNTYGAPDPQPELAPDLTDAVDAEITAMTASLPEPMDPGRAVAEALHRCVRACSPDLALRWSLRIAGQRRWPLERGQYERLIALGELLEYGEFIVSDVEFLVVGRESEESVWPSATTGSSICT
ncbi:hypothetical protein [Micromonospora psammae]|uniref:hypothetical protein n=1 Tax=Micromonospora sp. CPCC 205556 TaxID=3122398 RepID=UPI002FF033BD